MLKHSLALILSLGLFSTNAFAIDTSLRGFISLDALNFEKISGQKGSSVIGIGVLDLKVFAQKDDLSVAMKLDLDGRLDKRYNIFEEAYVTYRGIPDWRFQLGKGVVRFQNLHWGAVVNSYQDGGSTIGADNYFRKFSRKAFISAIYGGTKQGFQNQFTVWGDTTEINTDENGDVELAKSGGEITGYKTSDSVSFDTKKQIGLANKLDIYLTKELKTNISAIYYKNRLHTSPVYGVDFGLNFENKDMEIWLDSLWGVSAKLPYESRSSAHKYEYFIQLGMEYFLDEKWSVISNNEYLYLKDRRHSYPSTPAVSSSITRGAGDLNEISTYKIELALKYKLSRSSHITFGGMFEEKKTTHNGQKGLKYVDNVYNPNHEAYKLLSSLSFWF